MNLNIRQETQSDYKDVYKLNELAFGQDSESKLVDLLRQSDAFLPELSLVGTLEEEIVGHILFTKIQIIDDNQHIFPSLALAPVAVKPTHQKQGIGTSLIQTGLTIAKNLHFKSVIVLGHEHYYPKFGFLPAEKWHIKAPFPVQSNVFMGIELIENGLAGVTGTVQYPKAFEMV